MLDYILRCVGIFFLAWTAAAAGLHPLAMALIPVPVALAWAREDRGRAVWLGVCAAMGALPGAWAAGLPPFHAGAWAGVAAYALAAGFGLLLGVALRRWTIGQCVVFLTAMVFAVGAAYTILHWRTLQNDMTVFVNARIADLQQSAVEGEAEKQSALVDAFRAIDVHWPHLNLGMLFGETLVWAALVVGAAGAALRRRSQGVRGGLWQNSRFGRFRDVRPPEMLVWLAILLAILWFAERRWPNEALRMVAWNSAIGLSFVYWLNGFSILVYAVAALKWNPLLSYAVVLVLFGVWSFPILGILGFFDTWWEVRRRLDRLAEARRLRGQPGGKE
jgi:hypothetical protein